MSQTPPPFASHIFAESEHSKTSRERWREGQIKMNNPGYSSSEVDTRPQRHARTKRFACGYWPTATCTIRPNQGRGSNGRPVNLKWHWHLSTPFHAYASLVCQHAHLRKTAPCPLRCRRANGLASCGLHLPLSLYLRNTCVEQPVPASTFACCLRIVRWSDLL